jgi:hypothetical protein
MGGTFGFGENLPEKPLVFAHSPYQSEPLQEDEYSYTFTGGRYFLFTENRSGGTVPEYGTA